MLIPAFLFEEEDIKFFQNMGLLLDERYSKFTKEPIRYFKSNDGELDKVLETIQVNEALGDKADAKAMAIKLSAAIFTLSKDVNTAEGKLSLISSVASLYQLSPKEAKKLSFVIKAVI